MRSTIPVLAVALALGLGCATPEVEDTPPAPRPVQVEPAARTLFQPASAPLVLADPEGDGIALEELVESYRSASGQAIEIDEALAGSLADERLVLGASLTVPAQNVHSFFEAILSGFRCLLVRQLDSSPPSFRLTDPPADDPGWLRRVALPVPIERIADVRGHAALLVSTLVSLPSVEVTALCKYLRTIQVDDTTEELVPFEDTRAVLVIGTGQNVARWVDLLREIDSMNAAAVDPHPVRLAEETR